MKTNITVSLPYEKNLRDPGRTERLTPSSFDFVKGRNLSVSFADSVLLRLGHGTGLTCHRHVIQHCAAASLPKGEPFIPPSPVYIRFPPRLVYSILPFLFLLKKEKEAKRNSAFEASGCSTLCGERQGLRPLTPQTFEKV